MNEKVSTLLEVAGLLAVLVAAAAFDWRAALLVVGVFAVSAGWLLGSPEGEPE